MALKDVSNNKQAGVDEEMVQSYKLIFNIKPPETPETWTDLERSKQLAALEPEIQATGGQHHTTGRKWLPQPQLEGLKDMHDQIHTGDITRIPKNNDKDKNPIQAWIPIMCLRKITQLSATEHADCYKHKTMTCQQHPTTSSNIQQHPSYSFR